MNKRFGFTLVELLMSVVIISSLATIVFVALNPVQRYQEARNARRVSDVDSILTAIHEYIVDNNGAIPSGINWAEKQLGTCTSGGNNVCTGAQSTCLNLTSELSKYLKSMPIDPNGSAAETHYSVLIDSNNIITVKSCGAERGAIIEASR